MNYSIVLTALAQKSLIDIKDNRIRQGVADRINALAVDPHLQGKPLIKDLEGFRSVRAVGQRYRIIYRIDADGSIVIVNLIGIRKDGDRTDVYQLAKKLARLGLLD